eukprot:2271115-Pleurochrysis_carterae.AAC.1
MVPVPAANMASVDACGGAHFLVTSFCRFLIRICRFLSSTANRCRATKTALVPMPRLHSAAVSPFRPSLGTEYSSYEPPSASKLSNSALSCSL